MKYATNWQLLVWTWRWLTGVDAEARDLTLRAYLFRQREKFDTAQMFGKSLLAEADNLKEKQKKCNHRKGGFIRMTDGKFISCGSESSNYAVIKHQMMDGSWYIRCLRCAFTWKPGVLGYEDAILFPTRNRPSTAVQCKFFRTDEHGTESDDAKRYQAAIANS